MDATATKSDPTIKKAADPAVNRDRDHGAGPGRATARTTARTTGNDGDIGTSEAYGVGCPRGLKTTAGHPPCGQLLRKRPQG
jgi:hypothetical protein